MRPGRSPRLFLASIMLGAGLLAAGPAWTDPASEAAVKAGVVYNLGKFVEWPPERFASANAPLTLCTVGNQPLQGALALLQGRNVQGHPIVLRNNPRGDELRACHILYIDETANDRLESLLAHVASSPVLTVSDIEAFADQGGIVGLYQKDERVQFTINLRAARQNGLKLSSHLLRLGKVLQ